MAGGGERVQPVSDAAIIEASELQKKYGPNEEEMVGDLAYEVAIMRAALLEGDQI